MKPNDSSKEEEIVWGVLKPLLKRDKEGRTILKTLQSGKPVETKLKIWLKKHSAKAPSQLSTYISSGGTVGKVINVAKAETVNFCGSRVFGRVGLALILLLIGLIGGLYVFFFRTPHSTQYFLVNNQPLQLPGIAIPSEQQKKDAQQKVIQYQQEVKRNPSSAVAQTNLGEALRRIGNLQAAAEAHEKALKLNPNLAEAKLGKALVKQDKGNFAEAKQEIQSALAHGDSASAYFHLGSILLLQDAPDYKGAETAIRKAIKLETNTSYQYLNYCFLAITLSGQQRWEDAFKEIRRAISLNPNFKLGYLLWGVMLSWQNKIDQAIFVYQTALRINDKSGELFDYLFHIGLGEAFLEQNKIDAAIAETRKAIRVAYESYYSSLLTTELGYCYEILGKALLLKSTYNNQLSYLQQGIVQLKQASKLYRVKGKVQDADRLDEWISEMNKLLKN